MTSGEKKKALQIDSENQTESTVLGNFGEGHTRRGPDSKKIRRVNPLGMRVVVRLTKEVSQTDSGLYLPEGAKNAMSESLLAEVVEVASAVDDHTDEETNVSGVPLGATVLIRKDAGVKVPWDESLRIVETKDILAIVHEISIS